MKQSHKSGVSVQWFYNQLNSFPLGVFVFYVLWASDNFLEAYIYALHQTGFALGAENHQGI
jgi:hypothetical protein